MPPEIGPRLQPLCWLDSPCGGRTCEAPLDLWEAHVSGGGKPSAAYARHLAERDRPLATPLALPAEDSRTARVYPVPLRCRPLVVPSVFHRRSTARPARRIQPRECRRRPVSHDAPGSSWLTALLRCDP